MTGPSTAVTSAPRARELHGVGADAPAGAVDEDPLARPQRGEVEEVLGVPAAQRDRGGLGEGHVRGLARDGCGLREGQELPVRAEPQARAPEHLVAGDESRHSGADGLDDAREVAAEDPAARPEDPEREAQRQPEPPDGEAEGAQLAVGLGGLGGAHADQHLALLRARRLEALDAQHLGRAVAGVRDRVHRRSRRARRTRAEPRVFPAAARIRQVQLEQPASPRSRASMAFAVGVIESPPRLVHRSSRAMLSLISRWASRTSSRGIRES